MHGAHITRYNVAAKLSRAYYTSDSKSVEDGGFLRVSKLCYYQRDLMICGVQGDDHIHFVKPRKRDKRVAFRDSFAFKKGKAACVAVYYIDGGKKLG